MTKIFWGALCLAFYLAPTEASACGWSYESYHEESVALPCVFAVLIGDFPQHTIEYYETQIQAANAALSWSPHWLEGLQLKGLALMKLTRYQEAEEVFLRHLKIDPDGYASHANLGTLYTFTGDYARSLEHIDRALQIEPKAHFGREKYHRRLVVYLKEVTDPATHTKNFLGFEITNKQRNKGDKEALLKIYQDHNIGDDAFDALSSMISVYGAKNLAELYLAFADLLALSGKPKLAWTAYKKAIELKHPRSKEIQQWNTLLLGNTNTSLEKSDTKEVGKGGHHNIATTYVMESQNATARVGKYQAWERKSLKGGLEVWSDAGFKKCKTLAFFAMSNFNPPAKRRRHHEASLVIFVAPWL
jgi:tetratricopeptide (TPR) repeat protein